MQAVSHFVGHANKQFLVLCTRRRCNGGVAGFTAREAFFLIMGRAFPAGSMCFLFGFGFASLRKGKWMLVGVGGEVDLGSRSSVSGLAVSDTMWLEASERAREGFHTGLGDILCE